MTKQSFCLFILKWCSEYEDLLSVDVEATEDTQGDGEVLWKLYCGSQGTPPSAASQPLSALSGPTSSSSPAGPSFSSLNALDSVSPRGPSKCNFLFLQLLTPFSFYSPFLYSNQSSFWMSLPQRDFPQILRPWVCIRTFCQTSPCYLVLLRTVVTDYSCNDLLTASPSQGIRFLRANTLSALFTGATLSLTGHPVMYFSLPLV